MTVSHHLMIDVETFSLDTNAFVWEIGLLPFSLDATRDDIPVDMMPASRIIVDPLREHADHINNDTIAWTREQHPNDQLVQRICDVAEQGRTYTNTVALLEAVGVTRVESVSKIWTEISGLLEKKTPEPGQTNYFIWAKNSAFDFPILSNMFKGRPSLWHRRQQCCLYTAKNIALSMGWRPAPRDENNHSAADDCANQVNELIEILRFMKMGQR